MAKKSQTSSAETNMPTEAAAANSAAVGSKATAVAKTQIRGCEATVLLKNGRPFAVVGYSYKPRNGNWVNQSFSLPYEALFDLGAVCTQTHLQFKASDAYQESVTKS